MARKTVLKNSAKKRATHKTIPVQSSQPSGWRCFIVWGGAALLLFFAVPLLVATMFIVRPCQPDQPQLVVVASGQSLAVVAQTLHRQQLVSDPFAFRVLAKLRQQERLIQAGTYRFEGPHTPTQVLQKLVEGRVELARCTVPEGLTAVEVIQRCAADGLGKVERYQQLMADGDFRRQLQIGATSLEGYLFPETYCFAPGVGEDAVLKKMVQQTRQHLTEPLLAAAEKRGLDELQLLTLASIVQKEAGNVEEMPLISAVFHNRLKRGMLLQADPTVIYGIADFNGNITRKDLRTATPYNTYVNRGLPPGPIANPGLNAIRAAANPADQPYLYFVATGDGGHHFSRTLKEHNRAVHRYQLHR
ncbi:MAG: endolytic transglycosylase MltG [Desulfuromonas sp.]|nr:endolytic transglycosylase MltG [Desulfuromonas sp.]